MMKLLSLLVLVTVAPMASAQLRVGFYRSSCPRAEAIVRGVVKKLFQDDPSIAAGLLRLYFHDCFPNGCDASLLIASPPANASEQSTPPDATVRGYAAIAAAKSALEAQCPATVSCADAIALATRDAVALAGGPSYAVPTGRRDGLAANATATAALPSPAAPIPRVLRAFAAKGFAAREVVVLLGAHTVGSAHCGAVNLADPAMDRRLRASVTADCAARGATFLDHRTPFAVDGAYYREILAHRGVMRVDQELARDNTTAPIVRRLASHPAEFAAEFARALVKMGSLGVLVGAQGEIRLNCSVPN